MELSMIILLVVIAILVVTLLVHIIKRKEDKYFTDMLLQVNTNLTQKLDTSYALNADMVVLNEKMHGLNKEVLAHNKHLIESNKILRYYDKKNKQ